MSKVIVCGSIAIDRIMNFSGHYRDLIEASKLETLSVSVLVDSLEVSRGGTGANICHYLALLGETPALLGSIGHDGLDYLEDLAGSGIDTTAVNRSNLPTASFNVLTDSAGNQVGGFYPGAMGDADPVSFKPLATGGKDALFCLAAHDPAAMRRQVQECAELGLRLVYDPGQQVNNVSGEDLTAGVEAAEVVVVNDYELNLLAKKTGLSEADLRSKVPVLVSTHGDKGSVISSRGQSVEIGIAKPAQVTDPTGAGDAYRAGFLYGYVRQWELAKCGQLGAVMASFALEQHGPQATPSKQAVADRYQQTFNEGIEL